MENGEETRKIQFTGKSSYIVSLPKQWIAELELKKGDPLKVVRKGSSKLEIYPPRFETKAQRKEDARLEIGGDEDTDSIIRKLISLYFVGFKTIHLIPKSGRLSPVQRNVVKRAAKRILMGSEIISDSSEGVTIQVLVNLLELSVDGAFKRMVHLTKSMSNDAMLAARENNVDLAREVINTDDEVDRFGFYIIRQLKIAIQNEYMLKEMGFKNARRCLGYRLIVKNIERAGDHASGIAQDLLEFKTPIRKKILDMLNHMNKFCLDLLDDACLSLFKDDYVQAERTIVRAEGVADLEKEIREASSGMAGIEVYRIRRMSDNIRRVVEYASDISEIVLNMNIEKTLKDNR